VKKTYGVVSSCSSSQTTRFSSLSPATLFYLTWQENESRAPGRTCRARQTLPAFSIYTSKKQTTMTDDSFDERPRRRAIRHAEKRRVATCRFANRVALVSIQHYQQQQSTTSSPTCLATVLAYHSSSDTLTVLAMGVGTKFLTKSVLDQERMMSSSSSVGTCCYGERVRDCHAEVLARRAFRRYLSLEILRDLQSDFSVSKESLDPLLERYYDNKGRVLFRLRPGITLHFYTSSAPCGNAVLKKFAKLGKERFRDDLGDNEWPDLAHDPPIPGHAVPLGEFALLLKKDTPPAIFAESNFTAAGSSSLVHQAEASTTNGKDLTSTDSSFTSNGMNRLSLDLSKKQLEWPVHSSVDWCPPGTTTVWSGQGSCHTCSDKLCRWNVLGWQGSLLSSLFGDNQPLIVSTLVVGRKLNAVTCRRAVCCRVSPDERCASGNCKSRVTTKHWHVHHPVILGTSVYLDESGAIETTADSKVRFHSALSWVWWLNVGEDASNLECIDSSSGWLSERSPRRDDMCSPSSSRSSLVSTAELVFLFQQIEHARGSDPHDKDFSGRLRVTTLAELRMFKKQVSRSYEDRKDRREHSLWKT
jgi:hypothetical protein